MPGQDLLETFDRLTGQVRHPALTLDLFTSEPLDDSDDPVEDEPDEEEIRAALEPEALTAAQRRRGALMFAATPAKVAQDLAGDEYTYPACTAEELVLWLTLQQWQMLLDLTDLGPSWTDLSEYLFQDLDFEYLFDADMDGNEDDPHTRPALSRSAR